MKRYSRMTWLLLAVLGALFIARAVWMTRPNSFDEGDYRNVEELMVTDVDWKPAPSGYRVSAVLENRSKRPAHSIVLTAKVIDESDTVLGTSALVNVLNVPAQASRDFEFLIPSEAVTVEVRVTIEPAVVSWTE